MFSEILDNVATVVKQFKPFLNVHEIDEFYGKMPFLGGYHVHVIW